MDLLFNKYIYFNFGEYILAIKSLTMQRIDYNIYIQSFIYTFQKYGFNIKISILELILFSVVTEILDVLHKLR